MGRTLGLILFALPFLVYGNNYRHDYQLDDAYTILTNPSVRSLSNIPKFFVDPATYTSIREQADYRPVLQTTYALNYWQGGYDTWWWHFTQILLHAITTIGIYLLCRRILVMLERDNGDPIAFAAAVLFAIHPAASGVVNYLNARSSLLTAAFLLPALVSYLRSVDSGTRDRPQWATAVLYSLALFTKVEAVGALGALWAFELWQRARENPQASLIAALRATLDRRSLRRLAPALGVTVAYFLIRWRLMAPFPFEDARHAADVGSYEYFITQLTAWWYYIFRWIAPVRLVADNLAYPVFRSWTDPVVLLALGAWATVATVLVAWWRRAPWMLALAIAALALLSPTSSIAPLAEMVNEHRPYLPMGVLSLAIIIPIGTSLSTWRLGPRRVTLVAFAIVAIALGLLTYQRNAVFRTQQAYWEDVLAKAPSARAHLNYAVALMRANDMPGALDHLRDAERLGPNWYFTHINLGTVHQRLGQIDSARTAFDRAVALDRFSGLALTWRGEFRLSQRDLIGARDDFLHSDAIALHGYRNAKGLAAAYAALGDVEQSRAQRQRMLELDPAAAQADNAAEVQAIMHRGLAALGARKFDEAERTFREVIALNPTHYGAHYQLAVTLDHLGRRASARGLWERVLEMAKGYGDEPTTAIARARLTQQP